MDSTTSDTLKRLHERVDSFYAGGYLSTWCTQVRPEWAEFLSRVFPYYAQELLPGVDAPKVLDAGCGPSIAGVIAASRWSKNILMADYLKSNRDEVRRFWSASPDAFDWSAHFRLAGVLELNCDIHAIEQRVRDAIRAVYFCDVTDSRDMFLVDDDVDDSNCFDAVIASLVLDVVAVTDKAFSAALGNIVGRLRPQGLIVLQGSLGEKVYTVGSAVFPVYCAYEAKLLDIFESVGLAVKRWETCVKESTHYFALLQRKSE